MSNDTHTGQDCRSLFRFLPYIMITVNFVGWEIIKRTPVFISPTISQQALRLHGVITGSMLLLFTCVLFARFCLTGERMFHLYKFEKYLFILLGVDLVALMVGLIRRNAPVFLIGDTYKFSVIPLAYFCTTQTLTARDARKLFLFIVILETVVTLESFGVYIIRLATGDYERAPEHAVSLLAFIFFLVALTSGGQLSRRRKNIYSVILVIIGVTAILSQARTLWIQIFLCPFILLLIEKKTAVVRSIVKPAVLALILLMPFLLGVSAIYRNVARELSQRVVETTTLIRATQQVMPILSGDRRVVEVKSTLGTYRESQNVLDFIVGFGNGAEFYAPSAALGMGSTPGYKHHIHNGYISLFFRMGILGLTFFLLFASSALRSMYEIAKQPVGTNLRFGPGASSLTRSLIPKVIFVYFVATLIELLTIYSFIGDIKWGLLFGLFRAANLESGEIADENSN